MKIDPLALVQAIERYLVMRGYGRVRPVSPVLYITYHRAYCTQGLGCTKCHRLCQKTETRLWCVCVYVCVRVSLVGGFKWGVQLSGMG